MKRLQNWSPETRLPLIENVMPLECFLDLKCFLHINGNLKNAKA